MIDSIRNKNTNGAASVTPRVQLQLQRYVDNQHNWAGASEMLADESAQQLELYKLAIRSTVKTAAFELSPLDIRRCFWTMGLEPKLEDIIDICRQTKSSHSHREGSTDSVLPDDQARMVDAPVEVPPQKTRRLPNVCAWFKEQLDKTIHKETPRKTDQDLRAIPVGEEMREIIVI